MENKIYCLIRNLWVAALPEEIIRQKILSYMVHDLSYPSSTIVLEMPLKQMPHLCNTNLTRIPNRRADIVCFAKNIHPQFALYPLLLIECKAVPINTKVMNQVIGYNHHLRACYIAVANQSEMRIGWKDPLTNEYTFTSYLPSYPELTTFETQRRKDAKEGC